MSNAIKCIIRQSWTNRDEAGNLIERRDNVYVTNEDGTPHIYQSIAEARAEILANYGRDANRAGILHTHTVDEYSGHTHDGYIFIVREDASEYAEATREPEPETVIYSTNVNTYAAEPARFELEAWEAVVVQVTKDAEGYTATPCTVSKFGGLTMSPTLACHGKTMRACISAVNRMLAARHNLHTDSTIASGETLEDMHADYDSFLQWSAALFMDADELAAEDAAAALIAAYAEAIGEYPEDSDPETIAAGNVAAAEIIGDLEATAADLETVADMLEAIADRARSNAEDRAAWARNEAGINASKAAKDPDDAWRKVFIEAAQEAARKARAFATVAGTEAAKEAARYAEDAAHRAALTKYAGVKYLELEPEPAPVYQRYELESYLGDPDAYDVEAIEAEATAYDPKSGARVWSAYGDDLAAIAERHELYEYAPAI